MFFLTTIVAEASDGCETNKNHSLLRGRTGNLKDINFGGNLNMTGGLVGNLTDNLTGGLGNLTDNLTGGLVGNLTDNLTGGLVVFIGKQHSGSTDHDEKICTKECDSDEKICTKHCEPDEKICTKQYDPVCHIDTMITFSNECLLRNEHPHATEMDFAMGACGTLTTTSTTTTTTTTTKHSGCSAHTGCPKIYKPVCHTPSDTTFVNKCEMDNVYPDTTAYTTGSCVKVCSDVRPACFKPIMRTFIDSCALKRTYPEAADNEWYYGDCHY